jgi:hypothetical protein
MYVCVCVCMYLCTSIYVLCTYVRVYLCMYVCTYVYIYICMYVSIYACMWLRILIYYPSRKYIFLQTVCRKTVREITTALLFLNAYVCYTLICISTEMLTQIDIRPLSPDARFRFNFNLFAIFDGYRNTETGFS